METNNVYVFITSVKTKKSVKMLSKQLNILIPNGGWNFDLEDCDKILRVESKSNISVAIIKLLNENNFECKELF